MWSAKSLADYAECPNSNLAFWNGTNVNALNTTIIGLFRDTGINMDATIADVYCAGSRDGN